jgi:hypothetical protein
MKILEQGKRDILQLTELEEQQYKQLPHQLFQHLVLDRKRTELKSQHQLFAFTKIYFPPRSPSGVRGPGLWYVPP